MFCGKCVPNAAYEAYFEKAKRFTDIKCEEEHNKLTENSDHACHLVDLINFKIYFCIG
jgi:hypothetical protein